MKSKNKLVEIRIKNLIRKSKITYHIQLSPFAAESRNAAADSG